VIGQGRRVAFRCSGRGDRSAQGPLVKVHGRLPPVRAKGQMHDRRKRRTPSTRWSRCGRTPTSKRAHDLASPNEVPTGRQKSGIPQFGETDALRAPTWPPSIRGRTCWAIDDCTASSLRDSHGWDFARFPRLKPGANFHRPLGTTGEVERRPTVLREAVTSSAPPKRFGVTCSGRHQLCRQSFRLARTGVRPEQDSETRPEPHNSLGSHGAPLYVGGMDVGCLGLIK
jgi:hypothetical protein